MNKEERGGVMSDKSEFVNKIVSQIIDGPPPMLAEDAPIPISVMPDHLEKVIVELLSAKDKEIARLQEMSDNACSHLLQLKSLCDEMAVALEQFQDLVGESEGVMGLHLNGDIAFWDWLSCEWTDKLYSALAKYETMKGNNIEKNK